jgi:hypothetical protein
VVSGRKEKQSWRRARRSRGAQGGNEKRKGMEEKMR